MATKRKIVRKRLTAKFRRQNKAKVRKTIQLTKSKRHNKKRKHSTKRRRQKGGDENYDVCPICHETFNENDETITTICGHKFHSNEIINWCRGKNVCPCPICRENIRNDVPAAPNNPNQNNNLVNQNNLGIPPPPPPPPPPNYPPPSFFGPEPPTDRLEDFQTHTYNLLSTMPYEPLPEARYLDYVDLPDSIEGGSKERIKNLLICLLSDEDYFHSSFQFLLDCSDLDVDFEIVDEDDNVEFFERFKAALIVKMMNEVDDNLNYTDHQLRIMITDFLKACAANNLGIPLNNEPIWI